MKNFYRNILSYNFLFSKLRIYIAINYSRVDNLQINLIVSVKNLSIELLLYLVLQRGSLRYLLEWVDTALMCPKEVTISSSSFQQLLSQIDEAVNYDCKKALSIDQTTLDERISVNKVAVSLMKIVRIFLCARIVRVDLLYQLTCSLSFYRLLNYQKVTQIHGSIRMYRTFTTYQPNEHKIIVRFTCGVAIRLTS